MRIASNLFGAQLGADAPDNSPVSTLPETSHTVIAFPEKIALAAGQRVKVFDAALALVQRRWVQVPMSGLAPDQGYLRLEIQRSDGSFAQLYEIGLGGGEFQTASGAALYAYALGGPVQLIAAEERF